MISKELIKQIVDEYKGNDIADHLHTQLKLVEEIQSGIRVVNKTLQDVQNNYEKTVKDLKTNIKNYQNKCKHWTRTYNPDPSGNNDSFYECNICGKEF
jgi:hypothetical protein